MRNKHQRNSKGESTSEQLTQTVYHLSLSLGPMEVYQHPVATSHQYGWWMRETGDKVPDWASNQRHVHVNSEMTRSAQHCDSQLARDQKVKWDL